MTTRHAEAPKHHRRPTRVWWRSYWVLVGILVTVTAVVAVLLMVGLSGTASPTKAAGDLAPAAVIDPTTHPDVAALAAVGLTGATNPFAALPAETPALVAGDRPQIVYVGADYCPFCAARRWSLVVALSRFGTFSGLGVTTSSSTDVYPDTSTLSFHGAVFSSPYISFYGVETADHDGNPLDTPNSDTAGLLRQFDVPPYASTSGAIPFLDIANRYVSIGGGYSPGVLKGLSAQAIAKSIRDPKSNVGQSIMADANVITAAICVATDNQPASVCSAAPIPDVVAALKAS